MRKAEREKRRKKRNVTKRKNDYMMTDDEKYMARCLQLARHGVLSAAPNPMVGAVIVHEGRIIGEGWHRRCGGPHAEVNAVRSVRPADEALLPQATLYVNLEPCSHWGKTPPCAELIVEKRLRRVVVGMTDPFSKVQGRGIERLRDAGIEVTTGVLEAQCLALNKRFITFHTLHRPWITLKWAQSADGFIDRERHSRADGEPIRFSTPWTQMLVHRLRATHQAILVGRRTWELDQPSLTTRFWPGASPQKILLSKKMKDERLESCDSATRPSLITQLSSLHSSDFPYQSVLVEGGAQTLQSFIDQDLWDEAFIEQTDLILGDGVKAPEMKRDPKGRAVHVNFT